MREPVFAHPRASTRICSRRSSYFRRSGVKPTFPRFGLKLRRLALLLLLVPFITVALPASPASASGCWSYSCVGHDPDVYGCSWDTYVNGYAVDSGYHTLANLTNWYSNSCHTNWVAASLTQYSLDRGYKMYLKIQTTDTNGHIEYMCYPGPSDTGALQEWCSNYPYSGYGGPYLSWGDMVEGTNYTYGTVTVRDGSGNEVAIGTANQ
jgi:hypothetical protein